MKRKNSFIIVSTVILLIGCSHLSKVLNTLTGIPDTPPPTCAPVPGLDDTSPPAGELTGVYVEWVEPNNTDIFGAYSSGCVVNLTDHPCMEAYPVLVPNSDLIAFVSTRSLDSDSCGRSHIYTMNTEGSELTLVTEGSSPSPSPDGTRIVYSNCPGDDGYGIQGICVINIDGTGLTRLTDSGSGAVWSPDGSQIAFQDTGPSCPPSPLSIFGRLRSEFNPQPTPINLNYEIYLMNADGSNKINLTDNCLAYDITPQWTADGRIIFRSDRGRSRFDYRDYIMNRDGSGVSLYTFSEETRSSR
jgi:dipeptidyl aminopeptidase/acylaminoacyl peptidase